MITTTGASSVADISSLAVELIHEIVAFVSSNSPPKHVGYRFLQTRRRDLHSLRLVCRLFKLAVDPFLFSVIHFNFQFGRSVLERQISTLLDSAASPSRYCEQLQIRRRDEGFNLPNFKQVLIPDIENFKVGITSAIASLQNLKIVIWDVINGMVIEPVTDALIQLPQVEELRLNFRQPIHRSAGISSLGRLSHFRRITLVCGWKSGDFVQALSEVIKNSPLLIHLEFDRVSSKDIDLRVCLFHTLVKNVPKESPLQLQYLRFFGCHLKFNNSSLVHLKFLSSIDISSLVESNYDHFWLVLGAATTWLKEISVDRLSQNLLDYLQRYSGLTKFCLIGDLDVDLDQVSQLYDVSLPKHKESLSILEIRTTSPGSLCITPTDMASILILKELKSLCLTLALDAIASNDSDDGINSAKNVIILAFNLPRLRDHALEFSRSSVDLGSDDFLYLKKADDKMAKMILSTDISHLDPSWKDFRLNAGAKYFDITIGNDGCPRFFTKSRIVANRNV